jgi:hypothetical protein
MKKSLADFAKNNVSASDVITDTPKTDTPKLMLLGHLSQLMEIKQLLT